jgi:hypothetical protein
MGDRNFAATAMVLDMMGSIATNIIFEVSYERRTGRNRESPTGGGKQDQKIYTNRLWKCSAVFDSACVRHDRPEAVLDIGTSRPKSCCWT